MAGLPRRALHERTMPMANERRSTCGHDERHQEPQMVIVVDDVDSVLDWNRLHGREEAKGSTTVSTIP